jgi:hypothetical protein
MTIILFILGLTVGERLEYDAKFSFINIGTMTLEIKDTVTYNDVLCYHIVSVLRSASGLRFLFSIDDTVEVYTSCDDLVPYVFRERINESGYRRASDLFFNHDSHYVSYDDSKKINIEDETRDLLSFWYYLRRIPLEEGDTIAVNIHSSKENHRIHCLIRGNEQVRTKAGDYETIRVEPQTEGKGIFGAGGGMEIWYSEPERLPVQIRTSMKVGSVLFRLREVSH